MRIEVVTVCVDYADFLEEIVHENHALFDDWVIVTSKDDKATLKVCERHGLRPVLCPYFDKGAATFDKARAINLGLAHLTCGDWVIHLDADTALPKNFRHVMEQTELSKEKVYGIDRVTCPSHEEWRKYKADMVSQWRLHYLVLPPNGWRTGARISHADYGGWTPIGYFQMWNRASGIKRYPVTNDASAEHTDVLFSLQWPRCNRVLIPEIYAIHLESEQGPMGVNWNGRKSKPFAPDDGAVGKHHHHHHHHPYWH